MKEAEKIQTARQRMNDFSRDFKNLLSGNT